MQVTYKERQELNELSKEILGVPSRWRTLVRKGVPKNVRQLGPKAWTQERRWFFTPEEVKTYLFEIKELIKKNAVK
jgi:hypothetical protein